MDLQPTLLYRAEVIMLIVKCSIFCVLNLSESSLFVYADITAFTGYMSA